MNFEKAKKRVKVSFSNVKFNLTDAEREEVAAEAYQEGHTAGHDEG